jgi:hypothetical protein
MVRGARSLCVGSSRRSCSTATGAGGVVRERAGGPRQGFAQAATLRIVGRAGDLLVSFGAELEDRVNQDRVIQTLDRAAAECRHAVEGG